MRKPKQTHEENGHPLMQDPVENQRSAFDAYMRANSITNVKLAELTGRRESTFRNYRNGTTRDMTLSIKTEVANALHVPMPEIFGETMNLTGRRDTTPTVAPGQSVPPDQTMVPIFGRAEGGKLINTPHPVAYVEVPTSLGLAKDTFAVRVTNASAMPRFRLREVLIANPDEGAPTHDDCVIITKSGEIHILFCLEYAATRDFVGITHADPQTKITIANDQIDRIGRVAYIRT